MSTLPPWTASLLDNFVSCPHKYYRLRVLRDIKDFPPSEQILWGRKLHKAFEDAVNYRDPLPKECETWQTLVDKIKAIPGEKLPEYRFSIDDSFQPCSWSSAWSRGAADLVIKNGKQAIIFDYKTGKRKPSDQLALYAGFAFAYWPELEQVHTCFVWLKDKVMDKKTYLASEKHKIWELWLPLVARLQRSYDSDQWRKCPSGLCKNWCPVKDCDYCGL